MKRERWLGYIKDYDGGTLMECAIDTQVDYLNNPDTSETLPRHFRDTSETLPRHFRDTSETLPRHFRDTQVDYLNIRFVAEEQRRAIAERMEAGGAQQQEAEYAGYAPLRGGDCGREGDVSARHVRDVSRRYDPAEGGVPAGLQGTSWRESALHCSMQGKPVPLADCLQATFTPHP